ncbi:MAG: hypothetical protein H7232_12540, partial [Aeromicrobium sp.]|nr:hypothetical protein [Burkholderiales bacterium]
MSAHASRSARFRLSYVCSLQICAHFLIKPDQIRLTWVFALLFAAVAAIPIAIFTGVYVGFTAPNIAKSVERRQTDQATLIATTIDEYLQFLDASLTADAKQDAQQQVQEVPQSFKNSKSPNPVNGPRNPNSQPTAPEAPKVSRPEIVRMALLNPMGTPALSTMPVPRGVPSAFADLPTSVAAQLSAAVQARQALWSTPFISPRTGKRAMARIQPAGEFLILAEVSLDGVENIVTKTSAAANYRVLVVDAAGITVTGGGVALASPSSPSLPSSKLDLSNVIGEPNAASPKALSGRFTAGGEALVGRSQAIGTTGWSVIVAERQSVVDSFSRMTIGVIIVATLISIVAAVFAGMWLSRRAMLRVDQVIRFAGQLARGGTVRWQASRIREINLLGSYVETLANENKRREEARLEASALFTSTFRHSPVATSLRRYPTLELLDVNESWARMFDTSRAHALTNTVSPFQILSPTDAYTHINTEMAANRAVLDYPMTVRTASGRVLSVLVSCVRVVANDTDCQLTSSIDITERLQAEAARRESEARFSAIVATMTE